MSNKGTISAHLCRTQELHNEESEEVNLHTHFADCTKNPGHVHFKPIDDFNSQDLSEYYRDPKYTDFIKFCSKLTVRIGVGYISTHRPRYYPDTEEPFKAFEDRGKHLKHDNLKGTGLITHVKRKTRTNGEMYAEIWVNTAAHVVYDQSEAVETNCRLYFDREKCPVVNIHGCDVFDVDLNRDFCCLICETTDEDITVSLKTHLKEFKLLQEQVYKCFLKPLPDENVHVIISHPHGVAKHITVGKCLGMQTVETFNSILQYNTPTCPGSSGAPIIILGVVGWYNRTVHVGVMENLFNYSSVGNILIFTPPLSESRQNLIHIRENRDIGILNVNDTESCRTQLAQESIIHCFKGEKNSDTTSAVTTALIKLSRKRKTVSEAQNYVQEKSEAALHKHFNNCMKNPGHSQFIPIRNFTIYHLPEGNRDSDILDLIPSLADLTVRVNVNRISPNRPEFWPDTKLSYPFYNIRGKRNFRTGSGLIYDSVFYKNTNISCKCVRCEHSDTPSHTWWEIIVFTAAHVVFDDIEASHTSLRLFYDEECCPIISLYCVRKVEIYTKEDIAFITAVTCNADLANRIRSIIKRKNESVDKLFEKYHRDDDNRLMIMISHPHGQSKQVSVGHMVDEVLVGKFNSKYTYTTCTCPGSSGALAYFVNKKHVSLHSGAYDSNLNMCGCGFRM